MRTTTVIVGAGHAGLAMSRCLADHSIDHVILERGEVANSWKTERWDSLRLLTPNWQSRLPGYSYEGSDPDGYRDMPQTIAFIEAYARGISAPVRTRTTVTALRPRDGEYSVETDRGTWSARAVVVASGACNLPKVPQVAEAVPEHIVQISPHGYGSPERLPEGGVLIVGASATGVQIADEVLRSGRPTTLAVGEHVRAPRTYRGRDIKWWMDRCGVLDERYEDFDNLERIRNLPSLQLVGSDDRNSLDLNALTDRGARIVGRLAAIRDGQALFSGSLRNQCALADLKMDRLLDRIDEWAKDSGVDDALPPSRRYEPTRVPAAPVLGIDLARGEFRSIVWATGYRPDHSWIRVPAFDRKGRLRHVGGVVDAPGLYLMGMPFLRRRKSSLIDGAADDARELAAHLAAYLGGRGPGDRGDSRTARSR